MKKKDPYISELDDISDEEEKEEEKEEEEVEDPTRIDLPTPSDSLEPPLTQEILGLAPDLPVQLLVVIGRKTVTVKDLLGLRMGQVIDLATSPMEPVDLVAGGKVIGKGELVEVDGKLGVRVLKLMK